MLYTPVRGSTGLLPPAPRPLVSISSPDVPNSRIVTLLGRKGSDQSGYLSDGILRARRVGARIASPAASMRLSVSCADSFLIRFLLAGEAHSSRPITGAATGSLCHNASRSAGCPNIRKWRSLPFHPVGADTRSMHRRLARFADSYSSSESNSIGQA